MKRLLLSLLVALTLFLFQLKAMNGLKLNLHSFLGLLIYVSIKNLDKVPIFSYLFKGYSFEQITELIQ